MKENEIRREKDDKEYVIDVSEFDFCNSTLKKLAMKIRTNYAKYKIKNYYYL